MGACGGGKPRNFRSASVTVPAVGGSSPVPGLAAASPALSRKWASSEHPCAASTSRIAAKTLSEGRMEYFLDTANRVRHTTE